MAGPRQRRYDVVVVGAGHNGLVAAAYLAGAGLSVLVLERLPVSGGATSTAELFPGMPARLSPYAGLVALFPDQIVKDLDLDVQFRSRRTTSYAPAIRAGRHTGLLVERNPTQLTSDSFRALTGSGSEYDAWRRLQRELETLAGALAPTLLEPLPSEPAIRDRVDPATWAQVVETPIGALVEQRFADEVVRGIVATRALAGTFADLHSPTLDQNRTFLYSVIGNGSGEWRQPLGGVGALAASIERAVWRNGGEVVTRAFVTRIDTDGRQARVTGQGADGNDLAVDCTWVLGNVAPWVISLLLGEHPGPRPEGAQLKVDMLLDRLPRLRSGVSPPLAFAGTVHVAQGYEQLQQAYRDAAQGLLPDTPPGELHCASLTDPSVLGTLAMEGKHAFSFVGYHAAARLFSGHVEAQRDELVLRVLDAVNVHLEEPIETLVSLDREGNPCLRAQAPQDVEATLAMPGGHGFHGPLSWPWVSDRAVLETPAQRWGVQTAVPNVLRCGAGALRGGAVSGVGGHNAAMAVLESVSGTP